MYQKYGNESIWVMVGILLVSGALCAEYLWAIIKMLEVVK